MRYAILALPIVAPLLGYLAGWRWGGRRWWLAILFAGLGGAAFMAWIGATMAAMATEVEPVAASLRGAAIGLGGGLVLGGLADLGRRLLARRATPLPEARPGP